MTAEETAAQIGEFTVARLDVKPGDVVIVRSDLDVEEQRQVNEALAWWSQNNDLGIKFLCLHSSFDLSLVHTMTEEELKKAGAGGWPHEGQT